ncbi:MAG: putative toxin-antitoxin system toxin component, PIN family [Terracidiphilus sp.]|jgi:putative PIN family toxin of toxin-antitoxin system
MIRRQRVVFNTNVLVSRVLPEESAPGRAVRYGEDCARLLASAETLDEFRSVLLHPRFDRFAGLAIRHEFIERYRRIVEMIAIPSPIRACRDPKDDKFLALAVFGEAATLISGDMDLLALNPFRGIRILSPADCLAASARIDYPGAAG